MNEPRPRGHRPASRWVMAILVFAIAFLVTGLTVDRLPARDGTYSYLKLFNEVLLLVRNSYVEEVDMHEVMRGAYDGLLGSLDPQSEYLTAEQFRRLTGDRAADEGDVGIDLSRRGGYLYVVSVIPASPAAEAGVEAGTRLRRIGGISTRELTLAEAQLMLRGKVGTQVALQRFPGGEEPEELTLTRAVLQPPPPARIQETGATVLQLPTLGAGSAAAVRAVLEGIAADAPLVIDLRGTSSGSYDEAVEIASLFVTGGEVARLRRRDGEEKILRAAKGPAVATGRVAVLVDRGTAGPAELLAQALRVRRAALVVGGKTFGRGNQQEFIPLNDGGYLHLSVARYVDPEGNAWDGSGLMPDHLLDGEEGTWIAQVVELLDAPAVERPAA